MIISTGTVGGWRSVIDSTSSWSAQDGIVFPLESSSQCTTKSTTRLVQPAKTQISLCSLIRVFANGMYLLQPWSYPKKDKWGPLPYWSDVQAGLSLSWLHRSYCRFCRVLAQLIVHGRNFSVVRRFFILYEVQGTGCFQYWNCGFSFLRISGIFTHDRVVPLEEGYAARYFFFFLYKTYCGYSLEVPQFLKENVSIH